MTLLVVNDLHVEFISGKDAVRILHGVNLTISKKEVHALVGESGSGKSVTAMSIIRLLGASGYISQGEIWLNDQQIHLKKTSEMQSIRGKHVGMVFQNPMTALNPTLCVGYQIAESLMYHEKMSMKQAKQAAIDLLAEVGIASPQERYKAYPFQLSGGMCQRVAIAIALACRPHLLIADEPTTALDATTQSQILHLLKKIVKQRDMGVLLITHDLRLAATFCDNVSVMLKGKIVEKASAETLFNRPEHPYTQKLLSLKRKMLK